MKWTDSNIKSHSLDTTSTDNGISISLNMVDQLWTPDFYVYNLSDHKAFKDSILITRIRTWTENPFNENETMVEYKMEGKAMVYCDFYLPRYPMDVQKCLFRFGSQANDVGFVLFDDENKFHHRARYEAVAFEVVITFVDDNIDNQTVEYEPIGFDIKMERVIGPFIFKYYLPCFAIVTASSISFIIPLTAIPGRVALMVTQFLTLTNLFIYQMVLFSNIINIYLLINEQ